MKYVVFALVVGVSLAAIPSPARASGSDGVERAAQSVGLSGAAVEWAIHWQRQAEVNLHRFNRIRACCGLDAIHLAELHARDASSAGAAYKRLARHYAARYRALHRRIAHPPGVGAARWLPLARHVGWPEHALPRLTAVIRRESGGRPGASNGVFIGLLQIWQAHAPTLDLSDPEANLATGLALYRRLGWSPWAL